MFSNTRGKGENALIVKFVKFLKAQIWKDGSKNGL